MNVNARHSARVCLLAGVILVAAAATAAAESYPPTITFGAMAEGLLYPSVGRTDSVLGLQANGLLGWRSPLGSSGGYLALSADADVTGYFFANPAFADSENLDLLFSLPAGTNRLEINTGLSASALGTLSESPYVQPDWELEYRLERGRREVRPYLAYKGRYRYEPLAAADVLYQGAELGFLHRPSIRLGYQLGLEGGWELWPEYDIVDGAGSPTADKRQDMLVALNGEVEGLAGYFLTWNAAAKTGLRLSNGNRYLADALTVQGNSESAWLLQAEAGFGWSPHRRLDLQVLGFGRGDFYMERMALNEGGLPAGDKLNVLSTGVSVRADWTLDDRLYFVGSAEGAWRLSNDPAERRWSLSLGAGIEYSLY